MSVIMYLLLHSRELLLLRHRTQSQSEYVWEPAAHDMRACDPSWGGHYKKMLMMSWFLIWRMLNAPSLARVLASGNSAVRYNVMPSACLGSAATIFWSPYLQVGNCSPAQDFVFAVGV